VVLDRAFGPLVSLSVGGPLASLLSSPSYRILPLTDLDVADLVRSAPGHQLLFGEGGAVTPAATRLETILLRVAEMAEDVPEIVDLRLEVVLEGDRAVVASASVKVARSVASDPTLRRLR
jgi:hypothetical protein